MSPEYGSNAQDLPPETQFVLLELSTKGPYAVLLPLIDSGKFRATLRPPRCLRSFASCAIVMNILWQQLSCILIPPHPESKQCWRCQSRACWADVMAAVGLQEGRQSERGETAH